jgi:Zn-dependent peptidase ImmA (M78 family)
VADGLCVHSNDVYLILASSDFSLGHVRFTLAHELGHHLFGDPREIIGESSKEMFAKSVPEWRANAFAANFLMPERGVRRLLELRGETTSVSLLGVGAVMQHFQTSKQATCYRLDNLGLLASGVVDSFSNVPARDLIDAGQASFSDSSVAEQLEVIRPPTRLLRTALDAFAHKQIGLGPVATLLERPDDDELFAELLADSQIAAVYDTASRGRELEV